MTASTISDTRIDLDWNTNPEIGITYNVYRSASTGFTPGPENLLVSGLKKSLYLDSGLPASTDYHYAVTAVSTTGLESDFTRANNGAAARTAPAAPTNLTAAALSSGGIELHWTENGLDETHIRIERSLNGFSQWQQVALLGANAVQWSDTTVTAGTRYVYRARAVGDSGDSDPSNVAAAVAVGGPLRPPFNLTAHYTLDPQRLRLAWQDDSGSEAGTRVERSDDNGVTWAIVGTTGADETSFTDEGLVSGTTYLYRAQTFDGSGGSSGYSAVLRVTAGGQQIGPYHVVAAPISAHMISGDGYGWFNQYPFPVSVFEAFSGVGIIDDGYIFDTGPIVQMRFDPGALVNGPGPDLVVFNLEWSIDAYAVSTEYDGYLQQFDIWHGDWERPGITIGQGQLYYGMRRGSNTVGPTETSGQIATKAIDLSALGVPENQVVENIRVHVLDGSSTADLMGVGSLNSLLVDLVAHRTGGKLGEEVAEQIENSGDPTKYLILANNDFEEELPDGQRDYDNNSAIIPTGSADDDDDLAKISLKKLNESLTDGTYFIELSDPSAVRVFTSAGTELTQHELAIENPSGYLAGVLSNDIDVWLEGLHKDTDFVFKVGYRDQTGAEQARKTVHMTIGEWKVIDGSGEEVRTIQTFAKEIVLEAANGDPYAVVPPFSKFKIRIDGLAASEIEEMKISSDSGDHYFDTMVPTDAGAQSLLAGVIYSGATDADSMSDTQKAQVRQTLGLNTLNLGAPPPATQAAKDVIAEGLTRQGDKHHRPVQALWLRPNWGFGIGAMTYSSHAIQFRFPAGSNANGALANAIYQDLKDFAHFQPNIASVAKYARQHFDLAHFKLNQNPVLDDLDPNKAANLINSIDVALYYNDQARRVQAVTLGYHPLVGSRAWQVWVNTDPATGEEVATIFTEAWERARAIINQQGGFLAPPRGMNDLGRMLIGHQQASDMWEDYLQNIAEYWEFTGSNGIRALPGAWNSPVNRTIQDYPYSDYENPFRWQLPTVAQENHPVLTQWYLWAAGQ